MRRFALILLVAAACGACDRSTEGARDRSATAGYDWRQHRENTPEANAARTEMGMLLGHFGLAREGEVRAEMKRLTEMREAGTITPFEHNRRAIAFMREWVKQNPQKIEQLRARDPKRYEQLVQRLDSLHRQHAR